jgi:hypothetical protein
MDDATILRLLNVERQTVADTGVTLERTPCVVRRSVWKVRGMGLSIRVPAVQSSTA